jgi:K(+)-stimulated pyrophosphate-energized sodium pump
MILGWASFGHKGVIFPLLVRAVGVIGSIIGTYAVRTSDVIRNAMRAINIGFILSAFISIAGFALIGFFYLRFTPEDIANIVQKLGVNPATFPIHEGLDMRPVWTTMVGIFLAISINRLTEHFTSTKAHPVKSIARSTQTGHATTIITGLAVGYESTVWAILVIAISLFASVLVYHDTNATFVAYGVAMCGIGMLTLTGNNISMDVYGPVSDNANGIGEMANLEPEARQTLADLDSVGNTTKAITKGVAIGSAVIAAVSLFNAYITNIVDVINKVSGTATATYATIESALSISIPYVFIGFLIGGAVPFLFSSMTIRAVGRAAFLIVNEVREQFKIPGVMEGTKTPDYARVVSICTTEAQRELIGPGLLAILAPIVIGFVLHKEGLGGFLAGMILTGQLLAVFMANAGGAWDNAKKTIEDEPRDLEKNLGKGSERHKAAVTGDTVGDPLKDTSGPALNPLIKVMNMVALLVTPFVVKFESPNAIVWVVALAALAVIGWAIWNSKRETEAVKQVDKEIQESLTSYK